MTVLRVEDSTDRTEAVRCDARRPVVSLVAERIDIGSLGAVSSLGSERDLHPSERVRIVVDEMGDAWCGYSSWTPSSSASAAIASSASAAVASI